MDTSEPESYTRRRLLRAGAGAVTAGTVAAATTGAAGAQDGVYGGHLSDADNFGGTTADATGMDEVRVLVGASGNGGNLAFNPPAVVVDPGTTVVWEWTGEGGGHNVVHRAEPDPARDQEAFNSQGVAHEGVASSEAGTTFEQTFEDAAPFFPYVCTPHVTLGMKGVVVVGEDNAQTDLGAYALGSDELETTPIWGGAAAFGFVSFLGVAAYRTLTGDSE
ncbi:MAG: halocyanin-like protein [Halovenus sp.]|jgi:halocyanin-like protein